MATTVVPQGTSGGGGAGSGSTITVDTLAVIEALTPAVGDLGKPKDSVYELECEVAGTWKYRYGEHGVVTKPPTAGWTDTGTGGDEGGARTWIGGATITPNALRAAATAGFRFEVLIDLAFFSTGDATWTVNLEEAATGEVLQVLHTPDAGDMFVTAKPNGWLSSVGQTLIRTAYNTTRAGQWWVRVEYDLTNVRCYMSQDGRTWTPLMPATAVATYFTTVPDRIRIGSYNIAGTDSFAHGSLYSLVETPLA